MKNKQFAALPYKASRAGPKILLITTRKKGKWSIPKGWPMKGRHGASAAAIEAFEEAGVVGKIKRQKIGRFEHRKARRGQNINCLVEVFPLKVDKHLRDWPEKSQRKRRWFLGHEAAQRVKKKGLKAVIAAAVTDSDDKLMR